MPGAGTAVFPVTQGLQCSEPPSSPKVQVSRMFQPGRPARSVKQREGTGWRVDRACVSLSPWRALPVGVSDQASG